ncbi:MAG TPA: radical SAM protein [Verrucomicrobiae bacterium]|nr:radical SAM protein [Verrucomicrobiae bacterium]
MRALDQHARQSSPSPLDSHPAHLDHPTQGARLRAIWLNVNRACNLRCSWCYVRGAQYSHRDEMSLETAARLLEIATPLGVKKVILIGGEPTLWRPLFSFIRVCKDLGVRTTLVTNGVRFSEDPFWEAYKAQPCSGISVSIKAFNPKSFRDATGTSNFEEVARGLRRALNAPDSSASVVFSGNDPVDLLETARFSAACGARNLGISPSTPAFHNRTASGSRASDPRAFAQGILAAYHPLHTLFGGQISFSLKLPLCLWPKDFVACLIERKQLNTTCQLQHRSGLVFDPAGRLIACNSLYGFPIGMMDSEFGDCMSLFDHIHSEPINKFYDSLNCHASTKCMSCPVQKWCAGGCPLFYSIYDGECMIPGWQQATERDDKEAMRRRCLCTHHHS